MFSLNNWINILSLLFTNFFWLLHFSRFSFTIYDIFTPVSNSYLMVFFLFLQGRIVNIIVGFVTIFIVIFTMLSAFIFDKNNHKGLNITLALVIAMICASHLLLVSILIKYLFYSFLSIYYHSYINCYLYKGNPGKVKC